MVVGHSLIAAAVLAFVVWRFYRRGRSSLKSAGAAFEQGKTEAGSDSDTE